MKTHLWSDLTCWQKNHYIITFHLQQSCFVSPSWTFKWKMTETETSWRERIKIKVSMLNACDKSYCDNRSISFWSKKQTFKDLTRLHGDTPSQTHKHQQTEQTRQEDKDRQTDMLTDWLIPSRQTDWHITISNESRRPESGRSRTVCQVLEIIADCEGFLKLCVHPAPGQKRRHVITHHLLLF